MSKTSEAMKKIVIRTGIARIASASVVNKIVAFLSNVIVIRLVSQYDYGLYSSAYNVISIAILFTGLGTISGVLQYGAESRAEEEKNQFFKYCAFVGVLFDVGLTVIVLVYAGFNLMPIPETKRYIIILAPSIVLHYIFEYFGAVLRSKKEVKRYATLLNVNSISFSVFSCVGAWTGGIVGLSIGRSLAYIMGILMGIWYNMSCLSQIMHSKSLQRSKKVELIKYSLSCCITAALNRLLYVIDIAVITHIVRDPSSVATYKVGTTIPEALEFIPQSILVAVIPYFAEHNKDLKWLQTKTKQLYLVSAALNSIITILLILFSTTIIKMFWGETYIDSVPIFIALSINYFVLATFRQTGTNILSTLRYIRYNVLISIVTCVLNLGFDILFVSMWGINGAAYATLLVAMCASALSMPYLIYHLYIKCDVSNNTE